MFDNPGIGAAVVTDATEFFMLASSLLLLPRGILGWAEARQAVRILLAGALMGGLVWYISGIGLLLCVPIGAAVYLAASFALKTITIGDGLMLWQYLRHRQGPAPQVPEGKAVLSGAD
jgi:hypothetical protein